VWFYAVSCRVVSLPSCESVRLFLLVPLSVASAAAGRRLARSAGDAREKASSERRDTHPHFPLLPSCPLLLLVLLSSPLLSSPLLLCSALLCSAQKRANRARDQRKSANSANSHTGSEPFAHGGGNCVALSLPFPPCLFVSNPALHPRLARASDWPLLCVGETLGLSALSPLLLLLLLLVGSVLVHRLLHPTLSSLNMAIVQNDQEWNRTKHTHTHTHRALLDHCACRTEPSLLVSVPTH
jgi:hypothetical protein